MSGPHEGEKLYHIIKQKTRGNFKIHKKFTESWINRSPTKATVCGKVLDKSWPVWIDRSPTIPGRSPMQDLTAKLHKTNKLPPQNPHI